MFRVGDRIAYPMHGAGTVRAIEELEILGKKETYVILDFIIGQTTVKVPVSRMEICGIRPILPSGQCVEIYRILRDRSACEGVNWNQRYRLNMEKIRSGNLREVADVVRSLACREREKGLSVGEKKMYLTAWQIVLSELMMADECDEAAVCRRIGGEE